MEVAEKKLSLGYGKPPWLFKGSALYQFHLVKAETARAFIPKDLRLVEAFGYTLGGFFLAHYDDSPAGTFDELVVIAGIVWNPPTSCAWAARVLVSSHDACNHGRKGVGLPSQVAGFSKRVAAMSKQQRNRSNVFGKTIGMASDFSNEKDHLDIQITEMRDSAATDFCTISLTTAVPELKSNNKWMGPVIKMSLPSFSGCTKYNPNLLKYSCEVDCRVRAVEPAKISGPNPTSKDADGLSMHQSSTSVKKKMGGLIDDDGRNHSILVLLSKPVLALEFSSMRMRVEAPTVVAPSDKNTSGSS